MGQKVLIPQDVAAEGKKFLTERGYEIKMGSGAMEADLVRDVSDCDAILLRTAPCTKAVLEAGKNLKIVARHGAGYNNVDLDAAAELGIWVTNAPDSTTNSVAEYTIGAMIAAAKRTVLMVDKTRNGEFFYKNNHKGVDLVNKTLAIVGLGRIGQAVAKKAYCGLDMKIIAYDPWARKENLPDYITLVDWDSVFKAADFVSLHLPYTKGTAGLIGAKELNQMKPTAFIINCSRGGIIVEADLVKAMQDQVIAGLYTDVFEVEPPAAGCVEFSSNPLLHMENVTAAPHMASNTEECMTLMAVQAASQIHKVLSGHTPDWPVNKPIQK